MRTWMPSSSSDADVSRGRGRGRRAGVAALALALAVVAVGVSAAVAAGGAPTVETERVVRPQRTSAVLRASVNPNGSAVSECYFEYGATEGLGLQAPCSYSPGSGETPVPVNADLEGLSESTTYYYRIYARSSEGPSTGGVREFTTLPTAPKADTGPAKPVGHTSATMNASVDPNESEVTACYFEWGASKSELTNRVNCSPEAPGAGDEAVEVSAPLTGLQESATYYYRIAATNAFGTTHGSTTSFGTLPNAPSVFDLSTKAIGRTSATLQAFVNPNDALVEECRFEWGPSGSFEHTTPCEPAAVGSGEERVRVSAQLTGLTEGSGYSFQVVAGNTFGRHTSDTDGFRTLPSAPKATVGAPDELTDESAVLNGSVNPEDAAITRCVFEYGTTPALGSQAPCKVLPGAGESNVRVSAAVSGLAPATSYVVRLMAVNAEGVHYSSEKSFTTFVTDLRPVVTKVTPSKGVSAGGKEVKIKGKYLNGATAVKFGETETTDITADTTELITVISPPGVGGATVNVTVTTATGESAINEKDRFTYLSPAITELSPSEGPKAGGTEVTVTGSGFEPGSEGTKFTFKGKAGSDVECASTTTCTVISPPYSKTRAVTVQAEVNGRKSNKVNFTYTA